MQFRVRAGYPSTISRPRSLLHEWTKEHVWVYLIQPQNIRLDLVGKCMSQRREISPVLSHKLLDISHLSHSSVEHPRPARSDLVARRSEIGERWRGGPLINRYEIGFLLYIPMRQVVFGRQPSRQIPMAGECNPRVSSLTRNEKLDRI